MTIYDKYGLDKVINASGKMTVLGVSKVDNEVADNVKLGLQNFFVIDKLFKKTNEYIAKLIDVEGVCIVSSASSGIAMTIASLITGDDIVMIENLYKIQSEKNEVLMLKGHNINYGTNIETMVNIGCGVVKEVGNANYSTKEHLEHSINENTLCMLYVKSHHCVQKNQISFDDVVSVCMHNNIPLIVDAAAEEDLTVYYKKGADVVIYSGAKAIEGPTSGLVIGKQKYTDNIYKQYKGIGRAMKIGKEGILGLTCAVERYINKQSTFEEQKKIVKYIIDNTHTNELFKLQPTMDLAGREITRVLLSTTEEEAKNIVTFLTNKSPVVETRNHQVNLGKIEFDVRQVKHEDAHIIVQKLNQYMERKCN